mmetsp:Transcript_39686/g.65507  ORF Transcript_39686/g.65507 Transcript_39686/m.65507 type:complete len:361 (-) Transcript_39686:165-1247(-)
MEGVLCTCVLLASLFSVAKGFVVPNGGGPSKLPAFRSTGSSQPSSVVVHGSGGGDGSDWDAPSEWEKDPASGESQWASAEWEEESTPVAAAAVPLDEEAAIAALTKGEAEDLDKAERTERQVRAMLERGATPEAVRAYTGVDVAAPEEANPMLDDFQRLTTRGRVAFGQVVEEIDYTQFLSHQHVEVDAATKEPLYQERFVYVDEYTCIGCTNCAAVAQNTFFMEEEFGRARVFLQNGDDDETVQIAVETCPVDCIHFVPWPELQKLELERAGMTEINFKARLVGGDGARISKNGGGMQNISGNNAFRCANCPTLGCANCPMYGVGENPNFIEKQKKKKALRRKKLAEEQKKQSSQRFDI